MWGDRAEIGDRFFAGDRNSLTLDRELSDMPYLSQRQEADGLRSDPVLG